MNSYNTTQINHLLDLQHRLNRRLRELEKKQATFGYSTPPEINTEIEDINLKLKNIEQQLLELSTEELKSQGGLIDPPPISTSNTSNLDHSKKDTYIFVSYSSSDKTFARQLCDSLSFYGIPIFLDERAIKVGDSIPDKIYEALDRATHLIYVLSNYSIRSEWVREELSIAKMKQLGKQGCMILPCLIDNVSPPPSISHIKYADFRAWDIKESYLRSLREVVVALDIETYYTTSGELRFLQGNLQLLIKIKSVADTAAQMYFQLEKLWFSLFRMEPYDLAHYFRKSAIKTLNRREFLEAYKSFKDGRAILDQNAKNIDQILEMCNVLDEDFVFFDAISPSHQYNDVEKNQIYMRLWEAEPHAMKLSAIINSTLLEMQNVIIS
jgi:TIR domain